MDAFDDFKANLQQQMKFAITDKDFQALCEQCKQVIKTTEGKLTAGGKTYHADHFLCHDCQLSIPAKAQYVTDPKSNQPYHTECFHRRFAEMCVSCLKNISDGKVVKARKAKGEAEFGFHTDCFSCGAKFEQSESASFPGCGISLIGAGQYMVNEGVIYCSDCHLNHFSPNCAACNQKIKPSRDQNAVTSVNISQKPYHVECFKCADCGKMFDDFKAYPLNDKFYCLEDHQKRKAIHA